MKSRTETAGVGRALLSLWRLARPAIWMVSLLPYALGHLLATRELFPGSERLAAFLLGALVIGPLMWAAILFLNDVHDFESDRMNPRRASSPLVRGLVGRRFAARAAYVTAIGTLAASLLVGWAFTVLVATTLALAWLYSVPPVRLKGRPGVDVAVNAIGVGVIAPLAGWTVARPLQEFPFVMLVQATLVAVAVYIPSTLVDLDADRANRDRTIAVYLGHARAYAIGWRAWLLANVGAVVFSLTGVVFPQSMAPVLLVAAPVLAVTYHLFIGRARSPAAIVRGIIVCSFAFLTTNVAFALMYTGVWK